MKPLKRITALSLALLMVLALAACGGGTVDTGETNTDATDTGSVETGSYAISVSTSGGMAMEDLDVYVYADDTLSDLKQYGQTDENGKVSFNLPKGGDYAVVLSGVPKGYKVADSYGFTGNAANIVLESALITGESLATAQLGLGSVMYDFTVATPDGETITLSEMLEEKDMVLINFWYTTCTYCVAEFPYLQQAYEMYEDSVGVIALNPFEGDDPVKGFQESMGLTFPMASCPAAWANSFGIHSYPSTLVVDRYGVICLVEAGGIPSLRPFTCTFDHFSGDDYEQILCDSIGMLVTDIKPTYTMEDSDTIAAAINKGELDVTYRPETEDDNSEFIWPFILDEKDGVACLKASNQQIDASSAILYADVYLEAGQAVGFDYLASTESLMDILYVIVNNEDVYQISGESDDWTGCYPWVALEDGYYELALCYLKDSANNVGDDTIYIKDLRVVDAKDIEVTSYIPRYAATTADEGFTYNYVDVVFNERDGYYHVGTADGPLLLADLMGYTPFSEEASVFMMVYEGDVKVNGESYYNTILPYLTLASNSALNGVCTVNAELAEMLKTVASIAGFDGTENEWLKICRYFEVYGAGDAQLADPIAGLSPFCAYKATLGKNVPTNYFMYDRPIIPRGLLAEFTPTRSGAYRFTSHNESLDGVEAWIHDANGDVIYTYAGGERMFAEDGEVSMVYYMEAGTTYYINIAFWDMYEAGYIYYDVEYLGSRYDLFTIASPGYFTYDTNATGDAMYYTISGGIDVILGTDGYYYEDLGVDANGNQRYGSKLYCDFTGITGIFDAPIATNNGVTGMIEKGAFDFSKTEDDLFILNYLEKYDFDVAATDAFLREMWGADYEAYAEEYHVEDVYEGIYHGRGEDFTDEISAYLDDIITSGSAELRGCVPVTEELAEILQALMEKYTFANVECSWPKLCYYYDNIGPEN